MSGPIFDPLVFDPPSFDRDALNSAFRYCCALTGCESRAADLLQDGLERYLRRGKSAHEADKVRDQGVMLRRILRNRHIDLCRCDHTHLQEDLTRLDDQNVGESSVGSIGFQCLEDTILAQDELEKIWAQLTASERELLHLWAVEGYTAREVSELLGQPRGSVLSRIHRLRQRLQTWRDKQDGPPTSNIPEVSA